jgi:hypothetical protein
VARQLRSLKRLGGRKPIRVQSQFLLQIKVLVARPFAVQYPVHRAVQRPRVAIEKIGVNGGIRTGSYFAYNPLRFASLQQGDV